MDKDLLKRKRRKTEEITQDNKRIIKGHSIRINSQVELFDYIKKVYKSEDVEFPDAFARKIEKMNHDEKNETKDYDIRDKIKPFQTVRSSKNLGIDGMEPEEVERFMQEKDMFRRGKKKSMRSLWASSDGTLRDGAINNKSKSPSREKAKSDGKKRNSGTKLKGNRVRSFSNSTKHSKKSKRKSKRQSQKETQSKDEALEFKGIPTIQERDNESSSGVRSKRDSHKRLSIGRRKYSEGSDYKKKRRNTDGLVAKTRRSHSSKNLFKQITHMFNSPEGAGRKTSLHLADFEEGDIQSIGKLFSDAVLSLSHSIYLNEVWVEDDEVTGCTFQAFLYYMIVAMNKDKYLKIAIHCSCKYISMSKKLSFLTECYFNTQIPPEHNIKPKIIYYMKLLLLNNFPEFEQDEVSGEFQNFITLLESSADEDRENADYLMDIWREHIVRKLNAETHVKTNCPPPVFMKKYIKGSMNVMNFSPVEIARQLTLLDYNFSYDIPICELVNKNYQKEDTSPEYTKLRRLIDSIPCWVATEILITAHSDNRLEYLKHFIDICTNLLETNSMNGLTSVYLGLGQFCIRRLKKLWKQLPRNYNDKWRQIENICNPLRNFKLIRERMDSTQPPFVPSITLLLHDIILTEEGQDEYVGSPDNKYLNLYKVLIIGKLLYKFKTPFKKEYNLLPVQDIQQYLLNLEKLDEQTLEDISMEIEPSEI
eukprot:TRINITY_DN4522_c0_g1_i1.p1 TRINITY_DN4522_c0_g1~~TRINITY_DN4522_c0_g1_i1.p1  ORF type:complete len:705 (+),score=121.23 TRINITY_DN4522_c0_g1_i1:1539-3653(+)